MFIITNKSIGRDELATMLASYLREFPNMPMVFDDIGQSIHDRAAIVLLQQLTERDASAPTSVVQNAEPTPTGPNALAAQSHAKLPFKNP
jgi:hypothetical protein